jgi:hypothetical protein
MQHICLYDGGVWVQFPVGARNFSLLNNVQTVSGVHPASDKICTGRRGALAPGIKRQGREIDHSSPSSVEVKKVQL